MENDTSTRADYVLGSRLGLSASPGYPHPPKPRTLSYVTLDHNHIHLLKITRAAAIALMQNMLPVDAVGAVVCNDGHHTEPKMVMINKCAIEVAPNLWIYNHDGKYYLTAPKDKVEYDYCCHSIV